MFRHYRLTAKSCVSGPIRKLSITARSMFMVPRGTTLLNICQKLSIYLYIFMGRNKLIIPYTSGRSLQSYLITRYSFTFKVSECFADNEQKLWLQRIIGNVSYIQTAGLHNKYILTLANKHWQKLIYTTPVNFKIIQQLPINIVGKSSYLRFGRSPLMERQSERTSARKFRYFIYWQFQIMLQYTCVV